MAAKSIATMQTSLQTSSISGDGHPSNSKRNIDVNFIRQKNEIEMIERIYNTEELSSLTLRSHNFLKFHAFLSVPQKLSLSFISSNNNVATNKNEDSSSLSVEYLPPIDLDIELPKNYPSESPPIYYISCIWLSFKDLQSICDHMDSIWSRNTGVLFLWTQFLKRESLNFLQLTNSPCYPIKIQEENKRKLKCRRNSRIKKCSENSNEMFLRKHLERYNVERKLSEFRRRKFTCKICFKDKFGLSCLQFQPCNHVFCRDCIRGYLQTLIFEGLVQIIKCPDSDCDCNILPAQVRELVDREQCAKYDNLLLTTTLATMTDTIRCPRQECQYPVTKEPNVKVATCPMCSYTFCVQCREVYHGVEPCRFKNHEKEALLNEYLNGSEDVKYRMEQKYGKKSLENLVHTSLSEKWIDDNTKNCCHCNASIEKSEGCNKIVCWRCNTLFCWNCLSRLDAKAPYAHYYDKNSLCFSRLFEDIPNDEEDDDDFEFHGFDVGEGAVELMLD